MRLIPILLLTLLVGPVAAAPVHIALKSTAVVSTSADGFFPLVSVADLSGGDLSARTRLGAVSVGRAPLSGETRRLTRGDLALKLRQAGCNPDKEVVLEGVNEACVTCVGAGASPAPTIQAPILHPGSPVTVLIQSGALSVTAPGIARQGGGVGDTIRVHRDGVMTDLIVTIVDGQTVRLEI